MAAQVLSFLDFAPRAPRDWSQQELAEFYRVEAALLQAGVDLETERGLSDEGDPWFVFCRADNGDVFIHFSRIDGLYVADAAAFVHPVRGRDFQALVRDLLTRYPLADDRVRGQKNVFMHPAALLIALVGAAFFHSNSVKAGELNEPQPEKTETRRASLIWLTVSGPAGRTTFTADDASGAQATAVILAAILTLNDDVWRLAPMAVDSAIAASHAELEAVVAASLGELQSGPAVVLAALSQPTVLAVDVAAARAALAQAAGGEVSLIVLTTPAPDVAPAQVVTAAPLDAVIATPEGRPVEHVERPAFLARIVAAAELKAESSEAIAAVKEGVAEASGLSFEAVVKSIAVVDRLPASLVDLITRGQHHDASAPPAPLPPSETVVVPVVTDGDAPAPVYESPDFTLATAATAVNQVIIHKGHDPAVDAAIALFISHVKTLDILVNGNTIILMDKDLFNGDPDANINLTSVTFTFDDGTAVALIGAAAQLADLSWAS